MKPDELDDILRCQLIIARLGEKELMNWWNTDIAYELGGATFLSDLLGETMAPLAAGEAILLAASNKEASLSSGIPNSQDVYSLFNAEPELNTQLSERLRHFKRYPDEVSEQIKKILDPKEDFSQDALQGMTDSMKDLECEDTSFGKQIKNPQGLSFVELYQGLTKALCHCDKRQYILHYYIGKSNGST